MNSYAATLAMIQNTARETDRRLRDAELRARNARTLADRAVGAPVGRRRDRKMARPAGRTALAR